MGYSNARQWLMADGMVDDPLAIQPSAMSVPAPNWRDVSRVAAAALAFRIVSAILALLVVLAFPLDRDARPQSPMWGNPSPFWDAFVRHDSGWYVDIARRGYNVSDAVAGGRSNIAFAPVYPLLMRYVGRLFGRSQGLTYLAGILVSWISFVAAMAALYYLAALDLPRRRAERAVLLTAIFPFAFFYGAVYTESTFLLFTVLSFYGFRTRRWAVGGVCGAIAGATRVTGILMWPALAWTAWRTLRAAPDAALAQASSRDRDRLQAAAALVVSTLGFVAFCAWVYSETGTPLLWATALTRWGSGYHPGGAPWSAPLALAVALLTHPYVFLTSGPMAVYDALYGVTALLFVAATPFVWRRFGAGYGLFMALNLYVPLSSGAFEGLGRYCSVLFPCFIWLATTRSARLATALIVVFAMFYTLGLAMFVTVRPLF
jgi:Mannosyltransferase (PIG-V)